MATFTPVSDTGLTAPSRSWLDDLSGLSEMAAMVAGVDWAGTSFGHPDTWSAGLRSAVRTCLTTRFPMLVAWGPDFLMIYNDGYREMLGRELHPGALGR